MPTERRWERRHTDGWTAVVIQIDADWFRAYAENLHGSLIEECRGTQLRMLEASMDSAVLMRHPHVCRCQPWQETTLAKVPDVSSSST